jgi:hypothetical protein
MTLTTYQGSCHCGSVKYEADIDLARGTGKCNCTFCLKARAWKAFVKPTEFRLQKSDGLTSYHAHPQAPLKHHCEKCGVRTHETGDTDYMGGPFVGVFVNTWTTCRPRCWPARRCATPTDCTTIGRTRQPRRAISRETQRAQPRTIASSSIMRVQPPLVRSA